jgi:superfamily II DNA or RNA helicase
MIKLTIDNSDSKIEGLSVDEFKELKSLLSYKISAQASHFSNSYSRIRYLLSKRGEFPSGLLPAVKKFLSQKQHIICDNRRQPQSQEGRFKLSLLHTPYVEQEEAVSACLKQHRGVVKATTGFGKSITIALLVQKLQLKTLIVVPNLELKNQLTDTFKTLFTDLSHITICNIDSKELQKASNYDCLIVDEAHHSAAKTYRALNKKQWSGIYHRYFFTATPFRSRDEENILFESVAGQLIYEVSHSTAVKKGYIVPLEAYYIDLPEKQEELFGNYASVYKNGVVNNEELNTIVSELLVNFHVNNLSTLCIVKEIEHGNILSNLTNAGFANGQSEDCRDLIKWFSEGKLKTLIGTHGVVGEGSDTRACEYVVLPIPVKSKNLFMQICGRAFRRYAGKESAKIILIKNNSHKWFKSAFKEQCKILAEEFGIKPTKLNIP